MQEHLRRLTGAALAATSLLLAGCAPAIQGKWQGSLNGANNAKVQGTLEFKSDNTFVQTFEAPMIGSVTATGTYKATNDTVDMTAKDFQLSKEITAKIPPAMQPMIQQQIKDQIAKNGTQSVKYKVDGDKLELTMNGHEATLNKVKQ